MPVVGQIDTTELPDGARLEVWSDNTVWVTGPDIKRMALAEFVAERQGHIIGPEREYPYPAASRGVEAEATDSPADGTDVRVWQQRISTEARRRWPDITTMREALALGEEVGEVFGVVAERLLHQVHMMTLAKTLGDIYRCIVKRDEGTRGTADRWTDQEKLEIGQAMGVLMTVAALEGFDIEECLRVAWDKMLAMPDWSPDMRLGDEPTGADRPGWYTESYDR